MATTVRSNSFLKSYIRGEMLLGGWNAVGKVLTAMSALLVITNLDVFTYGAYILIFAFYSLLAGTFLNFLESVVFNDIARFIAEDKESSAKRLFLEITVVRITTAVVLTVGLFLGADIVAHFYGKDIAVLFRILSALFLISATYTSMRMLFRARLRFGLIASRPIVYKSIQLFFLLYFLFFSELTIQTVIISYVFASFLATVIFIVPFITLYQPWKRVGAASRMMLLPIIKTYGKWPIFSQIASQSTANIRPWLIKFFVNTEAVAIYSVAESLFVALKAFIPSRTFSALLPREIKDTKKAQRILLQGTKYLTLFSSALAILGFFIVPVVVDFLVPKYHASLPLFYILLLGLPLANFHGMAATFLVVLRKQKFLFFVTSIKIISKIILPVLLLYFFGLWGMAIERVFVMFLLGVITYTYLLKYEIARPQWRMLYTFDNTDKLLVKKGILYARQYIRAFFTKLKF